MDRTLFTGTLKTIERLAGTLAPAVVGGTWTVTDPQQVQVHAAGTRSLVDTTHPSTNVVFDIASLTKVFTATAVALLIDTHQLSWSTPLAAIFPSAALEPRLGLVTIEQLLTHTSGIAQPNRLQEFLVLELVGENSSTPGGATQLLPLRTVPVQVRQELGRKYLLQLSPELPPGTVARYADLNYLLVGKVIEALTKKALHEFLTERVFLPLGLTDTFFIVDHAHPPVRESTTILPTEISARRGEVCSMVHDETAYALGGYAGHAGIFSTAQDLLRFAASFVQCSLLTPETQRTFFMPRGIGTRCRGGWDTVSSTPTTMPVGSPMHFGFTGTALWLDLHHGRALTLLSNRCLYGREQTAELLKEARREFRETAYGELCSADAARSLRENSAGRCLPCYDDLRCYRSDSTGT